ncbi:hypothetical protein SD78_2105 [Bacillus badius]|nr:hypothetical protein SD78_2105 [Bacillus badius]
MERTSRSSLRISKKIVGLVILLSFLKKTSEFFSFFRKENVPIS